VDPLAAGVLGVTAGLLMGALALVLVRLSERRRAAEAAATPAPPPAVPPGVSEVLSVLGSGSVVLGPGAEVLSASSAAVAFGLVRRNEVVHDDLRAMVGAVARDGRIREAEFELAHGPLGAGRAVVEVRVAPIARDLVLVLLEDRTRAHRVEEVRRDFVVNVSHELKTPVGGLALLAEAVEDAAGDPEAVARFAGRMKTEASRLTQLVSEIVDLSRLQSDTLEEPVPVDVAASAHEAVDQTRLIAGSREVTVTATGATEDLVVLGDRDLVVTAIRNLVANAINYSEDHTSVAVVVRRHDDLVDVAVTDQGTGIAVADQSRIFERFYRVDPARSRATGGTGLGLSIVKHICANHGGDVSVWSQEGHGSTFTIRLPAAARAEPATGPVPSRHEPVPREVSP
jgi:two-component system, OmpR family, sensor histidine kinase SenX3